MKNQEDNIMIKKEEYEKINSKILLLESKIFYIERIIGNWDTPTELLLSPSIKNNILEDNKLTYFFGMSREQQGEVFHNMSQEERERMLYINIKKKEDDLDIQEMKKEDKETVSKVYKPEKVECQTLKTKPFEIQNIIPNVFTILHGYFENFLLYIMDFIIDIPAE